MGWWSQIRYVLIIIPILLPFIAREEYYLHIAISIFIFAILASGLNLLLGYTGLVSLAQASFFGVGAYTSGFLTIWYGFSFWLALPVAMILAAAIAFLMGVPSFRTRGVYYIIVTIAFQLIASEFFNGYVPITGGGYGLRGIPSPVLSLPFLPALTFDTKFSYYYLTLIFTLLVFFIILKIVRSPMGLALIAIRENETEAASMGLNVVRYKTFAFTLAAAFAGLSGSLYAHYLNYASPGYFTFFVSSDIFVMVILGGAASLFGPAIGSAILIILVQWLYAFQALRLAIYGVMIVLLILFMPDGLMKILRSSATRMHIIK